MEANAKLLKKKRIAHNGSKLSKSNFDEQKLPPDDFVYNIMRDMDSNNVISYKQSQEVRSKKREDLSKNEGSTHNSYYNKQVKKVLPKKSCPLMKKCQRSIKHLKKNRCIPKPRAHVGFVPKPPNKPISYTEGEFKCGNSSKVARPNVVQSKAYSKMFPSNFIKNKVSKPEREDTGVHFAAQEDEVGSYLSSSDDDGAAFESFVQKVIEEGNDSSDSDSRLIINRNKSRNKSKQKKKKRRSKLSSDDENNKNVPKITSIPLSDSSDSRSEETFEVHSKSSKRKTDSPEGPRKRVFKGLLKSCNSESSEDPPSDMDTYNNNSSDDDFSVDAICLDNEVASDVNIGIFNVNVDSDAKLSNREPNVETSTLNKHQLDNMQSSNPTDVNSTENKVVFDTVNSDATESNDLLSSHSEITESVPKYELPCYVRLKRDSILDKEALTLCSRFDSSEDDCIVLSDDSDIDEMSTTSHSVSSNVINKTCESLDLSHDAQNKGAEIHTSRSYSNSTTCNSQSCEDAEVDDCVIMCEMSNAGLDTSTKESNRSNSLSSESLSCTAKQTSTNSNISNEQGPSTSTMESLNLQNLQTHTDNDECVLLCENSKPTTDTISKPEQSLNSGKTADSTSSCHENTIHIEEFNVQIVAVQSLVESSPNPPEVNAAELNEIEVIDLSDDDLNMQEIGMENKNSENGKEIGTKNQSTISVQEKAIQRSIVENNPSTHSNKTCNSTTLLSEHNKQSSSCENSAVQEQNKPDPKIMEILSKINFDCIKEILNRTKLDESNKLSEVKNFTSDNVLLPLPTPTTIRENEVENAITSNNEAFKERNPKIDKNIVDKRQNGIEMITEVGLLNSPCKINDTLVKLPDSTIQSSCVSSSENAMESSVKVINSPALVTDMNILTSKNVCIKEKISSEEFGSKSKTFQMVNAENRTANSVYNSDQENKSTHHLKASFENPLHNYDQTNAVCHDTTICDSSKAAELPKHFVQNKRQPDSKTCVETVPLEIEISQGEDASVSDTVNALKREDIAAAKGNKETNKCEIPESSADDLDAIATTYIQDLNPPNKKVIALIKLYKAEYAKYMQIKNTEVNVSAGLKLLHENQVKKLTHLRSSIKNLVKHDPCFHKVVQEDKVTTCIIKSEKEDKLEVKNISSRANSSKEREGGSTTHPAGAKPSLKFDSAGTSREKLLRLMMNIKCAECGKPATARCQGCAEVYYCSPHCGELSWKQGHYAVCKR